MSIITISKANFLCFRKQGETLKTFDNTLSADEDFHGIKIYDTCPVKVLAADRITFQVKADKVIDLAMVLTLVRSDGNQSNISITIADSNTTHNFWEAIIDFSGLSGKVYFKYAPSSVSQSLDDLYISEPIEVLTETEANTDTVKIQWFNYTYNNTVAFEMFYDTGIVPLIRLKANFFKYDSRGKAEVYENDGEPVKLKQTVQRIIEFETDAIPRYLVEMISIALAHDMFTVNEVAYISEKYPSVDKVGKTNLFTLSTKIRQVNVLGINAHDIGFDCDTISMSSSVVNHELAGVSGNQSQVITADYLLHVITVKWNAGTNVSVKIGTSAGGNQLHRGLEVSTTEAIRTVSSHVVLSGVTIYFAITGTGANVDIVTQTIKNEE